MHPNIRFLRQRAELLRQLRFFFDERGFLEVQPPCLGRDCVVDSCIDPIVVSTNQFDVARCELPVEMFLQTSPELSMKRMLAAGAPSIYSIGPVFRAGERGRMHNPEFTMLEWYDIDADMRASVSLLGTLVSESLEQSAPDVGTYRNVFQAFLGFDPIDCSLGRLQTAVSKIDTKLSDSISDDRDTMLDIIFSHHIQPQLGRDRPQIVTNYPLSQAALARASDEDLMTASRFELFASGVELANGYDELLDPEVLVRRATESNAKRVVAGKPELNIQTSLVAAMRGGLPRCAGVALGVDRLLMLRVGAESIDEVIPLTIEIA